MAQQTINIGASPNDGTGTPLRTAFQYTNSNFSELYTAVGPSGNNIVVPGNATITGDLTVDTNTLKVDSANNRVGINTATPVAGIALHVCDNVFGANLSSGVRFGNSGNNYYFDQLIVTDGSANPSYQLKFTNQTLSRYLFGGGANYWEWYANNTLGMTLNSTGLGVGVSPSYKLDINGNSAIRLPSVAGSVDLQFPYFGATNAKTIIRATGTADWRQTLKIQMNTAQSDSAPVDVLTFNNAGNLILSLPSVPPTLTTNGQLTVNATSDTNLRFSYRGSDGVTRVANITLA